MMPTSYPDPLRSFHSQKSSPSPKRPAPAGSAGRPLMKEAAYAELKMRIRSGDFTQGWCVSERQLAVQLEMSQTPVRAAREKLQIEGLVTIAPQHLESGKATLLSPRGS